jgi:hypothetical protein
MHVRPHGVNRDRRGPEQDLAVDVRICGGPPVAGRCALQPLEFVGLILFELERPAAIDQEQRVEADDVRDLRKVGDAV